MKTITAIIIAMAILTFPTPGFAEEKEPEKVIEQNDDQDYSSVALPEFHFDLTNYFIFKNDRDFDRTRPVYDTNGQTTGFVATVFEPEILWAPIPFIKMKYGLEIGDNIWSRNDVDQRDPAADNVPIVKHKEFWAEVLMPSHVWGFNGGYQYVHDPTHLFTDKYMGAFSVFMQMESYRFSALAGQIPDNVYEGISATNSKSEMDENNFENDDYLFALNFTGNIVERGAAGAGVWFRWNKTEVDRPESLLAFVLHAETRGKSGVPILAGYDLVGIWGRHLRAGLDNRDVERLAGAWQFWVEISPDPVDIRLFALLFSADDGDKYDQYNTGFPYSGWSRSRTLILSENWMRDQYDNLDERVAEQEAGLFLTDAQLKIEIVPDVHMMFIAGYAMALDDTNLGSDKTIGTELDGGFEWSLYREHVMLTLVGGTVLPGEAGAMLQNEIDLDSTEPLYHVQGAMNINF